MSLISGAEIIYNRLLQNKVKDVFVYTGGAIMPLIDSLIMEILTIG